MIQNQSNLEDKIMQALRAALDKVAEEELEYAKRRFQERGKEIAMSMSVSMMHKFNISTHAENITLEFKSKD